MQPRVVSCELAWLGSIVAESIFAVINSNAYGEQRFRQPQIGLRARPILHDEPPLVNLVNLVA
jgi:hypothetical protein